MVERNVITAIGDPEFESFVARTLHSQGWSVLFRAVDIDLLSNYLKRTGGTKPLLIYSIDIYGLDREFLSSISPFIERSIGFAGGQVSEKDGELIEKTDDVATLMKSISMQGRTPLLHQGLSSSSLRRSRVIGIASASHGDGSTTTAINCAIELNLIGKKVLLVDGHHQLPAIALLLGERNLNGLEPNRVTPLLEVFELTRENSAMMSETLIEACSRNDFVIIDLGLIPKVEEIITERRWQNIFSNWILENADDLWLISSPRPISTFALHQFQNSIANKSLRARITFFLNHRTPGKRGDTQEEKFLSLVAPSHPYAIRVLPLDIRGVSAAEVERSILVEVNPRGQLRRKILELATALTT